MTSSRPPRCALSFARATFTWKKNQGREFGVKRRTYIHQQRGSAALAREAISSGRMAAKQRWARSSMRFTPASPMSWTSRLLSEPKLSWYSSAPSTTAGRCVEASSSSWSTARRSASHSSSVSTPGTVVTRSAWLSMGQYCGYQPRLDCTELSTAAASRPDGSAFSTTSLRSRSDMSAASDA
eukprot:6326068-Prymnesium_polylepis.1